MAKIVVIKGESAGNEWVLTKDKFKIGRGEDNDLSLADPAVSRKHALIKYKNGRYLLTNFGRNGTKINRELIKSKYLNNGDKIEIGSTAILYHEEPEEFQSNTFLKEASRKILWNKKSIFAYLSALVFLIILLFLLKFNKVNLISVSPPTKGNQEIEKSNNPESYFKLARRLYREKEIREENLFFAIQSWQKGLKLPGKSDIAETVVLELKIAEEELDKKIKDEMFRAYQSYHLGNLSTCKSHLERILKLIPDPSDRRYQSALAKLKDLRQK